MNLADRIVAHVGGHCGSHFYIIAGEGWQAKLSASDFERDWRVAGALMEKCETVTVNSNFNGEKFERGMFNVLACAGEKHIGFGRANSTNEPHAIIEACVEALETDK